MKEAILLILKIPENPTVWEYAWFQLPYSLPGIFTFLLGIFLTYVSILSFLKKPKEDRIFFFHLSLCFLGNGILGLVLALRAIILDKELLLLFNNHLYIFVMLLTPSGFCIAYYITGKKSKSIAVYSIICWISYFLGVFDVFRFHAFQNEWLDYPFGFYPKANLFVSLWGVLPAIGFFLFVIPNTIQFVKSKKPNLNIPVLLGLNLLFFLPFTNLPSILGYKFYPGANFLFVPMLIFAFGVFRSDFLDINELLFQKRGLFYVITGFFSLLFIAIFLCIIAFLQPTAGGKLYSKPYFLVPLFSGFCLFFLAIYIAGNNPNEKINIMASLSLVTNGAYTIVLTTLALELPQIVCHRIQQLSYLLFTLAPSIQLRLVFLVMRLPAPKYMRFIDIASVTMLIWSQTPYFFGEGYYSYSYGYIAQSGPGLFLFGLLGFISVFLVFYHYWTNRKSESTGATRLIVWAFGLGGFLNLLNLPSTQGIKFYPLGTMQWIPACMIAYSVLKFGAVRVKGDAEAIGNRISILTFLGIPVIMLGYYLLIPNDIAPFPKIMHITLAMTPMFLAFYSFTFILIRPISEKLDDNFQALKREKQISEQAKLEIEMLNHFTYLINSKSNLKDIFVEISMFMYAKYSIKAAWLFFADEKREYLYAYKAYSYDKLPQEQYDYMMNLKVPLNEKGGMMFLSFKRKKPFYLPKIRKFEFEFDREIAEALALTSFLHVPLVSKDECVGIFAFSNLGSELHLKRNEISSIENLCSQIAGVIKTTHLLYQVEQTKSEVEFLNDIIQNVNSVSTLTDIMTFVIYHVEMKYGKMTFWLLITDRENTKLSTFSYNPPVLNDEITKYFKNLTIPLAKETGTIIQAYKNQVPYYSKISEIEYLSELDKDLISQGNWDYLFYIPLVVYEEVVGILFLHKDGGEFSLKERIELQRLGEQISGAIQNAQLLQITAEAKEEIDKLNELTQLLNSTTDISAIFKEIYNYLNQTMGFDQCWPLLVDKNKNELYTDKNMTLLEKILFFDVDFFLNFRMKLDESLGTLYQTYTKKVPLCIPDTSQTVEGTRTHIINQFNGEVYIGNKTDLKINSKGKLKSVFHFPLILQNEVIGILCISAFNKIKEVSKEDIQKLMRFSDQIAGVIYNAQLLKETEMAKKETEFLNEITKSINSVSTLTDIMTFVIYHLEERYGWMTTWLLTTDKENGKFTTFSYNPPRLDNDTIDYFKSLSIPITEESGIIYQVYKNQTHYYSKVSETYELSDLERKFIEKEKWNFLYYLPLVIYEEVVGILFLHRKDEFSIDERVQLERVSEQIAGAIQNAQLLRETEKAQEQAELERQKSEKLLLNILPKDVAEELKEKGFAEPILFESVSVLFTDFKGFTQIAESMTPKELVEELDSCFSYFDSLMERYNLEKLKTIGDSYMCAGGIPRKNKTHAIDCALAAMEIQSIMKQTKELKEMAGKPYWELRLGIHSGPLVAGVIGEKKFAYDVWGDTVNTASRMESSGTPGKINISGETYELIKDLFDCEYRGKVKAKNKGEVEMYYLNGLKLEYSKKGDGRIPGEKFWERYKGVTYKI